MPNEWQSVLDEIKNNVSDMAFSTYFTNLNFVSNNDGVVTFSVSNIFLKNQIETKYRKAILNSLEVIGAHEFEVIVKNETKPTVKRAVEVLPEDLRPVAKVNYPSTPTEPKRTPSAGGVVNYGNEKRFTTSDNGLNPQYRFDNYIIGSNNDVAVSAAHAIVDNPGTRYNPYFIYGGPGLGKTHLVQAIGNELVARYPGYKVLYTTIEQFYHDFVEAMRKRIDGFTEKYRNNDCLIVDDFQYIVGKEKSQEEFFHTFNELHQHNKQIIITSDRLPSQIATVDERLASRLMMGVPIDIQLPDFEARCAIIKSKAEFDNFDIDDRTVEYLSENTRTNVRELLGKLNRLLVLAEMRGVPPSELISDPDIQPADSMTVRKKNIQPKHVIDKVAKYYSLTSNDLLGTSRVKNIKTARQIAMYIMNEELGMSTVGIGNEFGKDHTTVMHGVKVTKTNLKNDFNLREQINELRNLIYNP